MDIVAFVLIPVALLAGLALGWFLGARGTAQARGERDAREADFKRAIADLAAAEERAKEVAPLREELAGIRDERDIARLQLTELRAKADAFEERLTEFKNAREGMANQFAELANRVLGEAQQSFLKRADDRFAQAGESNEAKLKSLVQPLEATLKRYEEGLTRIEKERAGSYQELRSQVAQLVTSNAGVAREAQRLANVLRSSPKARGRWGEEQLRTILESAGLAENVDFTLQTSVSDGERQLRPDCVVTLPGGRCIVIDVKCPLVAFEQAFDEEDEARRADLLLQHANALKSYANDLGRKGYWRQFDLSPDFVIMFVPGEHFLSAAAERAPDLIETAFKNGVIVASTINMLALAKVMAGMWRQEKLAEEAREIGAAATELYKRLSVMGDHVARLGRNLGQATSAYNSFVGSLESQVYTQARRLEALHIETAGKSVESPPLVDTTIRPLTKLETASSVTDAVEDAE
ncbi:MAG: DNA recombination protein RmuC [Pseudomonadota bacterium]